MAEANCRERGEMGKRSSVAEANWRKSGETGKWSSMAEANWREIEGRSKSSAVAKTHIENLLRSSAPVRDATVRPRAGPLAEGADSGSRDRSEDDRAAQEAGGGRRSSFGDVRATGIRGRRASSRQFQRTPQPLNFKIAEFGADSVRGVRYVFSILWTVPFRTESEDGGETCLESLK